MVPIERAMEVLKIDNCSGATPEISKSAKAFLLDMLSNKTLANGPGIGSGKGKLWKEKSSETAFDVEFTSLLSVLKSAN